MVEDKSIKSEESLGQWLKDRCKAERLSMRQAAVKTGLSHATIADIIKGASPSPETVKKLAQAFGGSGNEKLALEDNLLILAGYRTPRSEGEEPSVPLAQLIDRLNQFSEPQIKIMTRFADFLAETDSALQNR